jgi:hypothetical protein
VLFRGTPKTYKGGRVDVGKTPNYANGRYSRPPLKATKTLPAGEGGTYAWGEIIISRLGTTADRRLVALHENVHRLLTPKLNVLRKFRVSGRQSSYSRSPLSMYLEEALAETVAQVGVNGFRSVFTGIAFPVKNGYVTMIRSTSQHGPEVSPFLPELAGLIAGGFILDGVRYTIHVSPQKPRTRNEPLK